MGCDQPPPRRGMEGFDQVRRFASADIVKSKMPGVRQMTTLKIYLISWCHACPSNDRQAWRIAKYNPVLKPVLQVLPCGPV